MYMYQSAASLQPNPTESPITFEYFFFLHFIWWFNSSPAVNNHFVSREEALPLNPIFSVCHVKTALKEHLVHFKGYILSAKKTTR